MTADMLPLVEEGRCWSRIGVWGDRSCGELTQFGHCRNCRVYSDSGHQLLDRPAPDDYIDGWTTLLAREKEADAGQVTPYVVFRVGQSWLGLRAVALREVTQAGVIRTIPHRSSDLLLGLAAVRGEIHVCVSLHALVGDGVADPSAAAARFLVARHESADWLFPVDEVLGIYDVAESGIEPVPSTLAHAPGIYTIGIAQCGERSVGLMDEALVFAALQRGIA
ncbi:MAG: chemotaxis protein CheW [Vicinamibacterales bacterium]